MKVSMLSNDDNNKQFRNDGGEHDHMLSNDDKNPPAFLPGFQHRGVALQLDQVQDHETFASVDLLS